MNSLSADLFFNEISYLSFEDAVNLCSTCKKFRDYAMNKKYSKKWKHLICKTYHRVYNLHEKIKEIKETEEIKGTKKTEEIKGTEETEEIPNKKYNILTYVRFVDTLNPIIAATIYYYYDKKRFNIFLSYFTEVRALFLLKEEDALFSSLLKTTDDNDCWNYDKLLNGEKLSEQTLSEMAIDFGKNGCTEGIIEMIKYGANVQYNGNEISFVWIDDTNLEAVSYLRTLNANICIELDANFRNAAAGGHLNTVKYLLDAGADIHSLDNSAFRNALYNNHIKVIKYLISKGADINMITDDDLLNAKRKGSIECVDYLVSLGAGSLNYASRNSYCVIL